MRKERSLKMKPSSAVFSSARLRLSMGCLRFLAPASFLCNAPFMLKGARCGAVHIWIVCSWRLFLWLFLEIPHRQTQNMLKGVFMELGMPCHLLRWMRQRALVPLWLVCCFDELGPGNWWKWTDLKMPVWSNTGLCGSVLFPCTVVTSLHLESPSRG